MTPLLKTEFRTKVVLEGLKKSNKVKDVCNSNNIFEGQYYKWKITFLGKEANWEELKRLKIEQRRLFDQVYSLINKVGKLISKLSFITASLKPHVGNERYKRRTTGEKRILLLI